MVKQIRHIYLGAESLLTSLGDTESTIASIEAGVGGLRYVDKYGVVAGCIDSTLQMAQPVDGYTRFESLIIRQIEDVCSMSKIVLSDASVQLIISTTKGNVDLLEESTQDINPDAFLFESASRIASYFEAARLPIVISNACISGVSAFVVARDRLSDNSVDNVIVVGCDVLSDFIVKGFSSFKSISEKACRPYDADRDGLSLGEACGTVLLTTDKTKAIQPYVELCGGSVTNDANHISGPSRTGDGLYYAISNAMNHACVTSDQIGFVNTHGTATVYNDEMESKAIAWAELSNVPLNGTKGYIGHTLGAAGVVETIICANELRRNIVYGTLGYTSPGTPCAVNVSSGHRKDINPVYCIKTASGFGGCNAAIVLGLGEEHSVEHPARTRDAEVAAEYELPQVEMPFAEFIRQEFKMLGQTNMKFYKMSDLCKAVYVAVEHLLERYPEFNSADPTRKAIVLANRAASLEADCQHQSIVNLRNEEGASPAVFVYTLPNVAAGEMCIKHKIQGDNTFFIEDTDSGLAENYARRLIETAQADVAICGWCDKLGEKWDVKLRILTYHNN